ncbi:MAG TPA: succinylglutamate desuccinylase/aspartoacylase family protein [bacterium]|nr:succinylglutamate desuccinylase/aspartoacylase family protein [bacterium]
MAKAKTKYLPVKIKGRPEFKIAYWEIDSGKEGPILLITAALHGNEVHGSEVIRRFCPIAEKNIVKGRMIMIPFANPLALWNRRPHIVSTLAHPKGREIWDAEKKILRFDLHDNINCTWPGDPDGNEPSQVTHVLYNKIVKQATHLIDMHCWSRFTVTAALSDERKDIMSISKAAALPAISVRPGTETATGKIPGFPCTLGMLFRATGRIGLDMEFSGQYVLYEKEVVRGVRMLSNCSKHIGMFRGKPEGMEETVMVLESKTKQVPVKAPNEGLFAESGLSVGDYVKKGDILGTLFSDRTLKTKEIKAPVDGYLYVYGHHRRFCDADLAEMHPYSDKGDTLAIIIKSQKKKS